MLIHKIVLVTLYRKGMSYRIYDDGGAPLAGFTIATCATCNDILHI